MTFIDTHTHLYLRQFDDDRTDAIHNAIKAGVKYMFLPNIDSGSVRGMLDICDQFPDNCFPMMGLHPTSVKGNYLKELENVREQLKKRKYIAVGECGIDLYWDKSFFGQQDEAFRYQINLAKEYDLPLVIHSRDSFDEIFEIMDEEYSPELKGVFHCFSGNLEHAERIINWGFKLGIGGVVSFKNSGLDKVVEEVDLKHIILETDAPFLAPMPYRGQRNESAYIPLIARKIADLKRVSKEEVAEITSRTALELYRMG